MLPCEVPPLASFVADEMEARGWTDYDLASRMPGFGPLKVLEVGIFLCCQDENLIISEDFLGDISSAFGISKGYFRSLHQAWLENKDRREKWDCPERLLSGFFSNDKLSGAGGLL